MASSKLSLVPVPIQLLGDACGRCLRPRNHRNHLDHIDLGAIGREGVALEEYGASVLSGGGSLSGNGIFGSFWYSIRARDPPGKDCSCA